MLGPASVLLHLQVQCRVIGTPEGYDANCLSDHAPLLVSFSTRPRSTAQGGTPPIPQWIFKHPKYRLFLDSLCDYVKIDLIPDDEILRVYNKCILEAARKVRDYMLVSNPDGSESLRLVVDGLSRAMWLQNIPLARRLLRVSELACSFAEVRDGKVICLDPVGFENLFSEIRRTQQAIVTNKLNQMLVTTTGLTDRDR